MANAWSGLRLRRRRQALRVSVQWESAREASAGRVTSWLVLCLVELDLGHLGERAEPLQRLVLCMKHGEGGGCDEMV
jgi:hypothetical protein